MALSVAATAGAEGDALGTAAAVNQSLPAGTGPAAEDKACGRGATTWGTSNLGMNRRREIGASSPGGVATCCDAVSVGAGPGSRSAVATGRARCSAGGGDPRRLASDFASVDGVFNSLMRWRGTCSSPGGTFGTGFLSSSVMAAIPCGRKHVPAALRACPC